MHKNTELNEKKVNALRASNAESKKITRESIRTALLMLMSENEFEKISVSAIINKAGVSRAGFYRNYASKEEVMEDIALSVREHIRDSMLREEYSSCPRLFYIELFGAIKMYPEEFRILANARVPKKYALMALPAFPVPEGDIPPKDYYYCLSLMISLRAVVLEWFRNGMNESAEEMADIMTELFHHADK